jgi:hypothetical protein
MINEPFDLNKEFTVTSLTRADLEQEGYIWQNISDDTMVFIARKLGEYIINTDYWAALELACKKFAILRHEELHEEACSHANSLLNKKYKDFEIEFEDTIITNPQYIDEFNKIYDDYYNEYFNKIV